MSNLHSKQTGKQVHFPRDYERGNSQSIPLKIDGNTIGYIQPHNLLETTIDTIADTSASLQNKYFCIYSEHGAIKTAMYFDVDGSGSFTLPSGYDNMQPIVISSNDNANAVATAVHTSLIALETSLYASKKNHVYTGISVATNRISITQKGVPTPIVDVDTGFTITTTTTLASNDGILMYDYSHGGFIVEDLNETIADIVGGMVSGNTETGIAVTYDDAGNKLNFVVSTPTPSANTKCVTINGGINHRATDGRSPIGYIFGATPDTRFDGKWYSTVIPTPQPAMVISKITAMQGAIFQAVGGEEIASVEGTIVGSGNCTIHLYRGVIPNSTGNVTLNECAQINVSYPAGTDSLQFSTTAIGGTLAQHEILYSVISLNPNENVNGQLIQSIDIRIT